MARSFVPRAQPPGTETAFRFMTDLLSVFGIPRDEELVASGGGNSFRTMGTELLHALDRPLPPLDVLALAFHTPDLDFVDVAGCALAEQCAGRPDVFAVSGQGVGAPFTALRTLAALHATGRAEHSALLTFDQTTLPYPEPDVHGHDREDCAVLLRTDALPGPGSARLVFTDERPVEDAREALAVLERKRSARLVLGGTLAALLTRAPDADVVTGPRRLICASAWAALAACWPERGLPADLPTVVADYDPHAGRLFRAGLLGATG
ncbi:hypothetical protein [Streptomyces sp. NPDC020996]|uniref:hypothetical protein n=1 Tax=Streptomyces sp. NPDC020996 TaxID=3154791 RepID=UPI0033D3B8D6